MTNKNQSYKDKVKKMTEYVDKLEGEMYAEIRKSVAEKQKILEKEQIVTKRWIYQNLTQKKSYTNT